MEFIVLSRREVSRFTSESPYIVISVCDPDKSPAQLVESPACVGVLRLRFNDVQSPKTGRVMFSDDMAEGILTFVAAHPDAQTVVCQCEGGISRSAGIAAALAKIYGEPVGHYFERYVPNRFIYSTLVERGSRIKKSKMSRPTE